MTHQLLIYDDDVNLLGRNINIIQRNTDALPHADKEVGLEVNGEDTKYTFTPGH
jgi:hypothetical protein